MNVLSPLQSSRLSYSPTLPKVLQNLNRAGVQEKAGRLLRLSSALQELFPSTFDQPFLSFTQGESSVAATPLKVGVVLSGGQAPGGHNVIAGLFDALKKLHPDSTLIGFLDGPSGIIQNTWMALTEEKVAPYRNQGGFDIIGSGRAKIETEEQFERAAQTIQSNGLDGLVIVGGDDSNTNAAYLAEFCSRRGLAVRIVGVPKTIDGDLKNDFIEIPFGFDTASKIYSEIIGNLLKDALSAKKYYFFVKMMGRSASHIVLECALQTHVNLALIGEEAAATKQTLAGIGRQIADLICDRAKLGKNFGALLIPEGLLEFIPECRELIEELNSLLAPSSSLAEKLRQVDPKAACMLISQYLSQSAAACFASFPEEIQRQWLLDRDPHGNVQLSKIETERLMVALVEKELNHRRGQGVYSGTFNPQPLFCGYEGRAGFPSNFDCQYAYALGHVAALLIRHQASGYMGGIKNLHQPVDQWEIFGVPIVHMLHFERRKNKRQAVIKKALVDLEGPVFAAFSQARGSWRLEDAYCCPGPIQFAGPTELVDSPPLTLLLTHLTHGERYLG